MMQANRPHNRHDISASSKPGLIVRALLTGVLVLAALFNQVSDSSAGRKSRSGRWTATDLQLFNPNLQASAATAEWITDAGVLQASLAVNLPLSSTRYYTIEASGLVPPTFIGGMEVVSPTQELYGIVTHFDKVGAASFERGNDHYEIRDGVENSLLLEAPVIIKDLGNSGRHTNISILNPADNGTISVTIKLYNTSGSLFGSVNQVVVGNQLLDIDTLFGFGPLSVFTGWARILSDKPIGAYVSIYNGSVQGGYTAMPGGAAGSASTQSTQSTQVVNLLGLFPNTQPVNDLLATRTLYIVNGGTSAVTVLVGSIPLLGNLLNTVLNPLEQKIVPSLILALFPQLFVSTDQPVNSVLLIDNPPTLPLLDIGRNLGFTAYPMQKISSAALLQMSMASETVAAAQGHCAVAPTVYTGYQTWNSIIKVINPITPTGVITATFFPALGLSSVTTTLVLTKSLPYSTTVAIDFDTTSLGGTVPAGAVYLEANVPFLGDVTSLRQDEADGIMSYRTEGIVCVQQPAAPPGSTATPTPTVTPFGAPTSTPTPTPTEIGAPTSTATLTPTATRRVSQEGDVFVFMPALQR